MPCASSRSSVSVVCASPRSSSSSVGDRGRVGFEHLAGEPELHRERDEMLLRAVVKVALDLAARLVGRRDDAARESAAVRRWRRAGRRATPATRCRAASCAGQARPGAASSVSTRSSSSVNAASPSARAHTSRPSSSPECAIGATRTTRFSCSARTPGSQTCIHALPETCEPGDDRQLLGGQTGRASDHDREPPPPARAAPSVPVHTSRGHEPHRPVQRLGELQHQLVERRSHATCVRRTSAALRRARAAARTRAGSRSRRAGRGPGRKQAKRCRPRSSTGRAPGVARGRARSPNPSTTRRYTTPIITTMPPASIEPTSMRSTRPANGSNDPSKQRERNDQ